MERLRWRCLGCRVKYLITQAGILDSGTMEIKKCECGAIYKVTQLQNGWLLERLD